MDKYCIHCMSMIGENDTFCPQCGNSQNIEIPGHLLRPGTLLNNRYVVGKMLGEGGFGITYIGRDINLDRLVAIKEYYPTGIVNRSNTISAQVVSNTQEKEQYEQGCEKFLREARMLAKFSNEDGIVAVIDFFKENGTAYIIMEYLDGFTLKDYLDQKGRLTVEETMLILTPIISSLQKIHKQGLIHRDISPSNIMIANGKIKLIDFGSARNFSNNNKSLSLMLKPGFAPEEQYRSKGVQGPWTDVYSLCATIYRCITGIVPEEANDRTYSDELKTPSVLGVPINSDFENALMKGLAVYSNDRYQTVQELLDGLNGISAIKSEDKPTSIPQGRNDPSSNDNVAGKREDDKSTEWIDEHRVSPAVQPLPKPPQREKERVASVDNLPSENQNKTESVPSPTVTEKNVKKRPPVPLIIGLSAVVVLLTVGVILFASGVFNKKPVADNQKNSIDNQLVSPEEESSQEESPTESSENSTVTGSVNVTFETNGAAPIVSKFVSFGDTYGDLPVPEKEGYTFKGWSFSDVNQYSTQFLHNTNIYFRVPEAWGTSNDIYCHLWNSQAEDSLYPWQSEQQKCTQVNGNIYKYTIPAGANVDGVLFSSSDGYQTYDVAIATICENDLFYCIGRVPNADFLYEGAWSIHQELGPIPSTWFEGARLIQEMTDLDKIVINDYQYVHADTKVVCPENHTLYAVWEQNSDAALSNELGDNLYDYKILIDNEVYTLPMKYSDIIAHGWEPGKNFDEDAILASGEENSMVGFFKNEYAIGISFCNFSNSNRVVRDCYATFFGIYTSDIIDYNKNTIFMLPKGISLGKSSLEEIKAAYGEPSDIEFNNRTDLMVNTIKEITELTYTNKVDDTHYYVKLIVNKSSNILIGIEMHNTTLPDNFNDNLIPTAIPEEATNYVVPEELGTDLQSGIVEFYGNLYQLPAPLSAFLKNGWSVDDNEQDYISADSSRSIKIRRNGVTEYLTVYNHLSDSVQLKNGLVERMMEARVSGDPRNISIKLPNNIHTKMSYTELTEKLKGIECVCEDDTYYIPISKYTEEEMSNVFSVMLPDSCKNYKQYIVIYFFPDSDYVWHIEIDMYYK